MTIKWRQVTSEIPQPAHAFKARPGFAGEYNIFNGDLVFASSKRPHFVARFTMRWLLDWHWKDYPK